LVGTADEEISPQECSDLVDASRAQHGNITIKVYPDATHDFDDPGASRQDVPANAAAARDATAGAIEFFAAVLKP
jgi:carboxymethylenebutenolidase